MVEIHRGPATSEKLSILSTDAQYDLACACGTTRSDQRTRSGDDKWIYPVSLPNGGKTVLFKTLVSNICVNDCKYCPLRAGSDPRRCLLDPEETVQTFLHYLRARKVFGLFLSSGVISTPDETMERINGIARLLRRREGFRGYIHLKIIPGASDAAIEDAVSLATAVSLNIETAGENHFSKLSTSKNYLEDIISPLKLISRLTGRGSAYSRVKHNTQFVVGASDETDREVVRYSSGLYKRLKMNRVYFSAYQRGLGEPDLPGERSLLTNDQMLTREHRLYQVDWLMRKYGFDAQEIPFEETGNLSLKSDPKEMWARLHPEFYPIDINKAGKHELLRVPGLGPVSVTRILRQRSSGRISSLEEIGKKGKLMAKAGRFLKV